MKNTLGGALSLALLSACAAPPRPGPQPCADEVRGAADSLRVDHGYRPAPTGGEVLAVNYEHPARTYYPSWCWTSRWSRGSAASCSPAYSWRSICERPRYRCY